MGSQREFLHDVKRQLAATHPKLTWERLAEMASVEPRALKTYRMPEKSPDYREMPRLARAAIEELLHRTEHPETRDSIGSQAPVSISKEEVLPAALAALVMRQARQALLDQRPIIGVDRYAGDLIGLEREDRQAMALVSRARLRSQLSDVGAEIHDLLVHCMEPLGDWLPLPQIHAQRLSDVVLLDPVDGWPTREAQELAKNFVTITTSLEELLFRKFHEQLQKSSNAAAAGYYTRVREFAIRHPVATPDEVAELTSELPSALGALITQQFYEPVPDGWGVDGELNRCGHCGNVLQTVAAGRQCRTKACAESKPLEVGPRVPLQNSWRLTRGLRQYWQEPGFDEVQLFDTLIAAGHKAELYPQLDRVDIAVGDVGMDLKAYVSPELLAARITRSIGGLIHYKQRWLVVPSRLVARVPAYLERLRAAVGDASLRIMETARVAEELARA